MRLRKSQSFDGEAAQRLRPVDKNLFCESIQSDRVRQPPLSQNNASVFPNCVLISRHSALSGGALRPIVTNVGGGMRWTQRQCETGAAAADGEIVASHSPDAGIKFAVDEPASDCG